MKKFKFTIHGNNYAVSVKKKEKNTAEIIVNGTPFVVTYESLDKKISGIKPVASQTPGKLEAIPLPEKKSVTTSVKSPLPGSIVRVLVSEGQTVKRGEVLVVLESMKMENNVLSARDAVVKAVHAKPGQSVEQGEILIDLE